MQRHVPALDAFGGQCAQRAQVLRQAHGHRNLAQLLRGLHAHDLERQLRQRVRLGGAPHQAHRHGHLDGADQCAGGVLFPSGQ
ncbi:hypothetical protein D3C86_1453900 [compost metagenome]